jgi:cell filamentation protein
LTFDRNGQDFNPFFDDREVRAVWDEENNKWWCNVVDVVAVLYDQDDFTKANNYWRWLK